MFTNKLKITGMALLMALSLTACGGGNTDENQNSAPNATATESATPTATEKFEIAEPNKESLAPITEPSVLPTPEGDIKSDEMPAELKAKRQTVSSIDLDYSFKNYADDSIDKVFPASDFDTKAGAKFGLDFMQDLISTENFYMKRESGDDLEILTSEDFAPRMDEGLLNDLRKDVKKDGKLDSIPTSLLDGTLGVMDGEEWVIADIPTNKFNTPAVGTFEIENGNGLYVRGERTVRYLATNGKSVEWTGVYTVSVIPSGDDWKVVGLGFKQTTNPKVVK
ncbi:hypothetical protein [Glutamicibacter ardleyensis]|uniref:hypothetical protein n=1 Tax=Glutamicibacter ardleyensis TaxID=225894 RepID=UPI003FD6A048